MTHRFTTRRVALAALLALVFSALIAASAAVGRTSSPAVTGKVGPSGLKFYAPKTLPKGPHGTLIWERPVKGGVALKGTKTYLVMYKQVGISGKLVPVSGTVSIPNGKAPKGGWPVISFAHGTTGIADICAPSRQSSDPNAPIFAPWIKAGYAVVLTDYEGLGGPGPHPYLIGRSEGYGVLDIVRAARQLSPALSNKLIIAGHSQGGHAALWAASLAAKYTPDLKLRGVIAYAPASHTATEASFLKSVSTTTLTGLAATILRGIDIAYPSLRIGSLLTPAGAKLYPQTLTKCLGTLDQPNSFGGLPLNQLVQQSADTQPAIGDLQKNDPGMLKIGAPVLLEQGLADQTVVPAFTQQLEVSLAGVGNTVTFHSYPGADHTGVLAAAASDAMSFLKKHFGH
jgi:pimeloyl-ACP methyl ester carboxylesterase